MRSCIKCVCTFLYRQFFCCCFRSSRTAAARYTNDDDEKAQAWRRRGRDAIDRLGQLDATIFRCFSGHKLGCGRDRAIHDDDDDDDDIRQ